jgi:hypothetical protein
MFSVSLSITDWNNFEFDDNEMIRALTIKGPDLEYVKMTKFIARMVAVLRISIGDFGFDSTLYMSQVDNALYWIMFIIICLITCIIFLNFIIAEVSASYEKVKDTLHVRLM